MDTLLAYLNTILPLSKESDQALRSICRECSIGKGEDLQPIGHTCRTIYFVVQGALRVYYFKEDVDVTESFEFEHAVVARAESLFTQSPSKKGIQSLENSRLIAIDANKLDGLHDEFPELERLFRLIFERILVKTVQRLENLQFYSAEERYINLLNDCPEVIKRVPLKHIASFLGITPVSLSRIRAKV